MTKASKFVSEAKMRQWINEASYTDLLKKNRTASFNDPMLKGTLGEHFRKTMTELKSELTTEEIVALSNDT